MNTVEQLKNKRVKEISRELRSGNRYVETVGKDDAHNLVDVVDSPNAGGVTTRLIMGSTALMPFRALSYVQSVFQISSIVPSEQIQIVHANHLGQKVNGLDLDKSSEQSRILNKFIEDYFRAFPELEGRVLHAQDTPLDTDMYMDLANEALETNPEMKALLRQKGERHGGDYLRYIAAHYAFQDTDRLELDPISKTHPDQIRSSDIVSVGCLQEMNFYKIRMGMQALRSPDVKTSQIFTKHVTPPYYIARDGEPTLAEGMTVGNLQDVDDKSARRDLEHLFSIINQGEI